MTPSAPTRPDEHGIGARLTASVMRDDYVAVLSDALLAAGAQADLTTIETDHVSTFVRGDEDALLRYTGAVVAELAATGAHAMVHLLLSRGCPGEVACSPTDVCERTPGTVTPLPPTGHEITAQWSLYPLSDRHMDAIEEAISDVRGAGLVTTPRHYVTEHVGDVGEVLTAVVQGWLWAGRGVAHTVAHATVSINHPSTDDLRASIAAHQRYEDAR
jgi:hypothetical protein